MPRRALRGRRPRLRCCVGLSSVAVVASSACQLHHGHGWAAHMVTESAQLHTLLTCGCSSPWLSSDGEVPVEETSDASPFAELIQRARDAMASGSQEDQVARRLGSHPHAQLAGRRLLVG